LVDDVKDAMMAIPPYSLGFPSKVAQSAYYPGSDVLNRNEIAAISCLMEQQKVLPENTRVRKDKSLTGETLYKVLQASTFEDSRSEKAYLSTEIQVILKQGDHKNELSKICEELRLASKYAANDIQRQIIELYIESFETGDLEIYRDALRSWVRDIGPKVEHIIGFVEPYRDPYGIRAEFEGLVAIADPDETRILQKLVKHSDHFIRQLPWCIGHEENNGKGPFEKSLFQPPDFSSIHGKPF
jgi:dipeptidyl-peptidase III